MLNAIAVDISKYTPDELAAMATDEDSVHIRVRPEGEWHRLATNGHRSSTACGVALILKQGRNQHGIRVAEYAGPLCAQCFTPFELAESERLDGLGRLATIPDSSATNNNGDDNG